MADRLTKPALMQLAEEISFAIDTDECEHPDRHWCVDCVAASALRVVGPLLADQHAVDAAVADARTGRFPSALEEVRRG